ncbi:sugar transferase, partial [bacterium]|nr:sugar transferase [bacterium]
MKEDAVAFSAVAAEVVSSGPTLYLVADTSRSASFRGKLKRYSDVLLSGLAVALLSPLLLVISILVKRSSPGPILFVQERVGKDGVPFPFLKFRTMVHNSDD